MAAHGHSRIPIYEGNKDNILGIVYAKDLLSPLLEKSTPLPDPRSLMSLALIDLDDFKAVNDTHGHPCGDRVLQAIGALLLSGKRAYDTAARVGGEEFALILPGLSLTRAGAAITRILESTRELPIFCDGVDTPIRLTFSAGLACTKGKRPITADALYAQADKALYEAKTTGKNRLVSAPIADLTVAPEESLVRADEKRFLFTGTTKG